MIFEQAEFSMAMRAYANNDGFGAQFSISATMEMKDGFDIIEDLIGWPAVSITTSFFSSFPGVSHLYLLSHNRIIK